MQYVVACPRHPKETYKFNKTLGLRSTTLAGGLSKYQQFKEVKKGSEIVIATPGVQCSCVTVSDAK